MDNKFIWCSNERCLKTDCEFNLKNNLHSEQLHSISKGIHIRCPLRAEKRREKDARVSKLRRRSSKKLPNSY